MNKKSRKPAYPLRSEASQQGRVICAMSGGVDSSIAAAILKRKGYEVIGLFLNIHQNCSPKDAQKVAKKLNIPLKILNVRKEFKKRVVDYFVEEHKRGQTPNPCVECNRWIKFKFLMEKAMQLKADYIATGHYARIKDGKLFVARDKQKDQSYFLWTLKQKQLKKILFPIGDYTKKEVRAMAQKWDLLVFEKRESQEICFIATTVEKFLKRALPAETPTSVGAGPIITIKGEKVGEHEGLAFYTIGQRKGIRIGGIGPFYVVDKDFKNNALVVAKSEHALELYKKETMVKKVSWISEETPQFPLRCKVKIRYLAEAVPAAVTLINTNKHEFYLVVFDKRQRAVTPGQSAVFYKRNEVLGGGIIC